MCQAEEPKKPRSCVTSKKSPSTQNRSSSVEKLYLSEIEKTYPLGRSISVVLLPQRSGYMLVYQFFEKQEALVNGTPHSW